MSTVSISTTNLTIGYERTVVQHALNISLLEGEMVCMLGPNGCGKSTLLRTLAGLQPALEGTHSLSGLTAQEQSRKLALVLTERESMEQTSVHDVVAMGRYPYTSFLGGLSASDEQRISRALGLVDLQPKAEDFFNALSDGEKQRVLIAKALAQETPVILLDEPTAHLDLPNRIKTLQLLRRLAHEERKTVLISTHELELALQLSDRILLMTPRSKTQNGGVLLDTAENLRQADAFTPAFGMDIFQISLF